jgi:hypothetical protein
MGAAPPKRRSLADRLPVQPRSTRRRMNAGFSACCAPASGASAAEAQQGLIDLLEIDEIQACAILDMQLRKRSTKNARRHEICLQLAVITGPALQGLRAGAPRRAPNRAIDQGRATPNGLLVPLSARQRGIDLARRAGRARRRETRLVQAAKPLQRSCVHGPWRGQSPQQRASFGWLRRGPAEPAGACWKAGRS